MASTDTQQTQLQQMGEAGARYFKTLLENTMAQAGNRASDAVALSPADELAQWMRPTSAAAQIARQNGGTPLDVERANEMSAQQAKFEQQQFMEQARAQGATDEQIFQALQQAERTDDQILAEHRKGAYALGKANSRGDRRKEMEYHERLAERAARARVTRPMVQDVMPGQEVSDAPVAIDS